MESQLREYRARKAREKMEEERSKQVGTWTHIWGTKDTAESQDTRDMPLEATAQKLMTPTLNSPQEYIPRNYFLRFLAQDDSILTNLTFLKVLLWIVLFVLFLHLEFAAVFVVASFLYIIYSTLGTSRRRAPGELSAYSVFNPNFEQIEGTLTAAQFERELKYGIGSTNK